MYESNTTPISQPFEKIQYDEEVSELDVELYKCKKCNSLPMGGTVYQCSTCDDLYCKGCGTNVGFLLPNLELGKRFFVNRDKLNKFIPGQELQDHYSAKVKEREALAGIGESEVSEIG